jgi:hypothetical protein
MPFNKRQKLSPAEDHSEDGRSNLSGDFSENSFDDDEGEEIGSEGDEEIQDLKPQKSRQTLKRKLRATGSSNFGATLQSLLDTNAPSTLPLSLKPSIARKRNDEKLELRAKKVLQIEKKEKEDKARIKDVIGGWGGESERALRKVAQRGGMSWYIFVRPLLTNEPIVVKLFNVIQQSQTSVSAAADKVKSNRGTGKPTLAAPVVDSKRGKGKKDNIIGRGKESESSLY